MPKEQSRGKPTTRRYSEQARLPAVRLCQQPEKELGTSHGVVKRVADQLGYGVESVRKWWRDADVADGTAGPDAQRVVELEAENRDLAAEVIELRRANEILKRASAFFAAELDRPQK